MKWRCRYDRSTSLASKVVRYTASRKDEIVYHGLGLRNALRAPLPENQLYPDRVHRALTNDNLFPEVAGALEQLLNNPHYRYLKALVNTTKHRALVKAGFEVAFDFASEARHGIRIGHFEYNGKVYQPVWVDDFMEEPRMSVYNNLISVGKSLNRALEDGLKAVNSDDAV